MIEAAPPPPKTRSIPRFPSQVLIKLSTGITGLLLILYLAQHLLANLRIFGADPLGVSKYGQALQAYGPLILVLEIGLGLAILFHSCLGIVIWIRKRKARSIDYERLSQSKLSKRQSWSSRTMIWGGLVMLVFLLVHVSYFRFGPGIAEGYVAPLEGVPVRHFERLMTERFEQAGYTLFYCVAMIAVGFHLSHGFWSAFQSLGWVSDRNRKLLQSIGYFIAALFTLGFMSIPIFLFLGD